MKFRSMPALLFLLAVAAGAAPLCSARQRGRGANRPEPDLTQRELQRTEERDLLYKKMREKAARGPATLPRRQLALAQINEDFTRIQIVNNGLAQSLEAGGELDFQAVTRAASEIRKRAGRLKTNLALPEPGPDEPRRGAPAVSEPSQLKAALNALDGLVLRFVNNPGFQSVGVINAQWAVKARRDLEAIIELSGRVKTCSEQLHRAARKPR